MIARRHITLALLALSVLVLPARARPVEELDVGFERLYQLKPAESRTVFAAWQVAHPDDPLGSAAEAASLLFEECYRQGVLTSAYFLDDDRFFGKVATKPDPELSEAFFAAVLCAQMLARGQLAVDADDPNALYAMTMSVGLLQKEQERHGERPHAAKRRHACRTAPCRGGISERRGRAIQTAGRGGA